MIDSNNLTHFSTIMESMIELKHITIKNIPAVSNYIVNPEVSKFLTWKPYTNEIDIQKYFDYAVKCLDFPDEIFCIIFEDEIIGTAHLLYRPNESVQIGFGILPRFWNKGLGYKVAIEIIQYIRNSRWSKETKRIIAVIHKKNVFASRIFIKLDFCLEKENVKDNFDQYVLVL